MPLWASVPAALVLSLAGCWFITKSVALRKLGNVAPADNRWHQLPTPGLGGVPIFFSFALVALLSGAATSLSLIMLVCALPLLLLGVYDDIKPVSPKLKLGAQLCSAVLILALLASPVGQLVTLLPGHFSDTQNAIHVDDLSPMTGLLYIFWLVAIINAINLLDNMDGLAGGIALIACVCIGVLAAKQPGLNELSRLYFILAGALAGFLILNRNPAKLFMGDAGALWLGLMVGAGALMVTSTITVGHSAQQVSTNPIRCLLAIMICAVPISDTLMVMITRRLRGQPVSVGGSDHLSHRLVSLGLSERVSVAILWLLALVSSFLALLIYSSSPTIWIAPVCLFLLVLLSSIVWLTRATSAPNGVAMRNASNRTA